MKVNFLCLVEAASLLIARIHVPVNVQGLRSLRLCRVLYNGATFSTLFQ